MFKINEKVIAHEGTSSVGGIFIYESFYTCEVVKINAKSIRTRILSIKRTTNGKVTSEREIGDNSKYFATFAYWKTVRREYGVNKGKMVSFYKNREYGIIEVVEC